MHDKNYISLFKNYIHLLFNYISTRSIPQILSLKDECTLRFLNLLITSFCNISANSWLDIIPFLVAPSEVAAFLSKTCIVCLKAVHVDIHRILDS